MHARKLLFFLALAIPCLVGAKTTLPSSLNERQFMAQLRAHRGGADTFTLQQVPAVGEITYIPLLAIHARQSSFSLEATVRKLRKALKNNDQPFDHGRALFGAKKHAKGYFYRGRVYLVDGHHRFMASLYADADTLPVEIVGDLSALVEPAQLDDYMARHGLSRFRTVTGEPAPVVDVTELHDNPLLELVREVIVRPDSDLQSDRLVIAVKGADAMNFLELEMAEALARAHWTNTAKNLTTGELQTLLDILKRAAAETGSRLGQVFLLDHPTPVAKLDWHPIHLHSLACRRALNGGFRDVQQHP